MKNTLKTILFGALSVGVGAAWADSMSLNAMTPRILPVLVHVNAHGKVTEVSPSTQLPPRLGRLLRENLDEMISKPATDHAGHGMSSQVIINVALKATARDEGSYDARFAYVSSSPVPAGSWYWVHVDGHRLALASQGSLRDPVRFRRESSTYMNRAVRNFQQASSPARSQPTTSNASRASTSAPRGH